MSAVVGAVPLSLSGLSSKPLICLHTPPPSTLGREVNEAGKTRRGRNFGLNQVLDGGANIEVMRGC